MCFCGQRTSPVRNSCFVHSFYVQRSIWIGIDETCIGKRRKFTAIVLDLATGDPILAGEGKGEEALKPFRELLGKRKDKIVAVALDMGAAYRKAVRENLPDAEAVFDRFRMIKTANGRIDQLRRAVCNTPARSAGRSCAGAATSS
jgi:transposase